MWLASRDQNPRRPIPEATQATNSDTTSLNSAWGGSTTDAQAHATRRRSWPEVWDLPGGHVDDDESRAAALVRELDEELGIHIEAPVGSPWTTLQTDGMELSIYLLDHWRGEPHNAAPDEHDIIRWVTAEALPHLDLAHPSYNKLLRQGSTAV